MKKTSQISNLPALFACFLTLLAPLHAVEITFVGHQVDIEEDENTPTSGWRNPEPAKPLDIDGDHILGTDGWCLANTQSNPPYATATITGSVFARPDLGLLDNPADPAGEDTIILGAIHSGSVARGKESGPVIEFVINGGGLAGRTLRVGVLCDIEWPGRDYTLTLTQRLGGEQTWVSSPTFTTEGTALDVAFFDITGARDGDTFIITGTPTAAGNDPPIAGITFDTQDSAKVKKVVEPEGVLRGVYDAPLLVSGLFSDNAVLQRGTELPVWGWDDPGTVVTVKFAGQTIRATTDEKGRWEAKLQPLEASKTPRDLVVSNGDETFEAKGLLVGDVWLCAGQSNMEMHFTEPFLPRMPTDKPDFVKPGDWPTIRHLRAESAPPRLPLEGNAKYQWRVCDDETYKTFTAVGFFFAYTVSKEVDVPIGLINVAAGNTRIDSWVSSESIDLVAEHVPRSAFRAVYSPTPCTLFNDRVVPLAGLAIKGVLWYQGEANGGEGDSYFWKLKALIHGWRDAWGRDDIPFYFVQLPSFVGGWAPTREAQRKALTIPHTGMAVVTDAGDNAAEWPANLHPRNKYTVGQRLALWALAKDYGKTDLVYSGPLFKSAGFKEGKAMVSFDHLGSGLMAAKKDNTTSPEPPKPVGDVVGFELAGEAGQWHPAKAVIEADTVVVSSPEVEQPTAVRYLYTGNTDHGTLYNKEGLPASPFTTETLR